MKFAIAALALACLASLPAAAQPDTFQDPLLDQLAGTWLMTGTIAGNEVAHDVVAGWVLGHQYLRIHEVAREKDADGAPAYEALVFIGWDEPTQQYTCLWLDVTGAGGLTGDWIGHARRQGDTLPFVFGPGGAGTIHNTFEYHRDGDTWRWLIDNEREDGRSTFARVTLTRQP